MAEEEVFHENVFDPERMYAIRRAQGLRHSDLAERLKMNINTIGKWESGANPPSARNLHRLAAVLGVSVRDLYGRRTPGVALNIPLNGYSRLERQAILALLQMEQERRLGVRRYVEGLLLGRAGEVAQAAAEMSAAAGLAVASVAGSREDTLQQ